jgi:hypothetical protein
VTAFPCLVAVSELLQESDDFFAVGGPALELSVGGAFLVFERVGPGGFSDDNVKGGT